MVVTAVTTAVWRGAALQTASRSVTFGLRKFSEARRATEHLAIEADKAKERANDAFRFSQNSAGLLASCASVWDDVISRKQKAVVVKSRTSANYARLDQVHSAALGETLQQYETSTENIKVMAPCGGHISDIPAANRVEKG